MSRWLRGWRVWVAALVLGALFLWIADVESRILPEAVSQKCEQGDQTDRKYCPAYRAFFFFVGKGIDWASTHNGLITAIATGFIAAFTIVLARVTGRQSALTKTIAGAAEKSADAAQSQIALARETTILEQRAWIFGGPLLSSIKPRGVGEIEFEAIVHNYGRTPARVTEFRLDCANQPPPEDEAACTTVISQHFPMGPGDLWAATDTIVVSVHQPYVFGVVRYDDAFGRNRWSRFCGRLSVNKPRYVSAGSPYWSDFDKD